MDKAAFALHDSYEMSDYDKLSLLFQIHQACAIRTKATFSIVLLGWHPTCHFPNMKQTEQYDLLYDYITMLARNSDKVFKTKERKFVTIILAFSGNQESKSFLNRVFKGAAEYMSSFSGNVMPSFLATISEIANSQYSLDDILTINSSYFEKINEQSHNTVLSINQFAQFETEKIKVSIIDDNPITISILSNLLHNMNISGFDFKIRNFTDGYEFLESSWYKSGHTHIILLNDILPRKNGIEVMNYLRSQPNNEKYIIMLMSKRNTEEAIIYAFDNGADVYFSIPFNLRLIEAQIKSTLSRLR